MPIIVAMENIVTVLVLLALAVALFAFSCFLTSRASVWAVLGGWLLPVGIGAFYFVGWALEGGGDAPPGLVAMIGVAAVTPPLLGAITGTIWGWGRSSDED